MNGPAQRNPAETGAGTGSNDHALATYRTFVGQAFG